MEKLVSEIYAYRVVFDFYKLTDEDIQVLKKYDEGSKMISEFIRVKHEE